MQHGQVGRLVVEPSTLSGHDWLYIVGALDGRWKQHGWYRHVTLLVLQLSNRWGHGWFCEVLGGEHAVIEVVELADTGWICELVVAG